MSGDFFLTLFEMTMDSIAVAMVTPNLWTFVPFLSHVKTWLVGDEVTTMMNTIRNRKVASSAENVEESAAV